ncbi:DoxX family protein [Paenibacillus wulumuqiensis]|uniref:DoxX family protein n=1 Tax=Paenibacillus wulumuqiensis TaxID=1567107 RepID=UPI000619B4EE|nr:DoxX family protein [Paenibacillus wulumuqiensis]
MLSMGLLLIRVVIGVIFAAHGAQKLFGWFGGFGPKGTGGWMESLGIKPGVAAAVAAGLVELLGGLAFAAGLFTPIVAVLLSLTMVMAIVKVHAPNGFWNTAGGYEFNLILIVVLIGVALTGAGAYSLDALI